jgi:hypothetical protein
MILLLWQAPPGCDPPVKPVTRRQKGQGGDQRSQCDPTWCEDPLTPTVKPIKDPDLYGAQSRKNNEDAQNEKK